MISTLMQATLLELVLNHGFKIGCVLLQAHQLLFVSSHLPIRVSWRVTALASASCGEPPVADGPVERQAEQAIAARQASWLPPRSPDVSLNVWPSTSSTRWALMIDPQYRQRITLLDRRGPRAL
jgi:hypothetical protein